MFFQNIEKGFQAHYIREAIKFYIENNEMFNLKVEKNNETLNNTSDSEDMDEKILKSILWYLSKK